MHAVSSLYQYSMARMWLRVTVGLWPNNDVDVLVHWSWWLDFALGNPWSVPWLAGQAGILAECWCVYIMYGYKLFLLIGCLTCLNSVHVSMSGVSLMLSQSVSKLSSWVRVDKSCTRMSTYSTTWSFGTLILKDTLIALGSAWRCQTYILSSHMAVPTKLQMRLFCIRVNIYNRWQQVFERDDCETRCIWCSILVRIADCTSISSHNSSCKGGV